MLLRLAYLGVTNAFALLRLLPVSDRDGQGWNGVLPLRKLPEPDGARVKAYRRQAREQALAPLLLWSVSGLDGYLLLDGHARLVAAQAEHTEPAVLVLATGTDPQADHTRLNEALAHQHTVLERMAEQAARGQPGARQALDALTNRFTAAVAELPAEGRTRAWPLPGGSVAWDEHAAREALAWSTALHAQHQT